MNVEKYDKKVQRKLQKAYSNLVMWTNVFGVLSFILIIYGALTESWIRLLAGLLILLVMLIGIGVTKTQTDKIEEELKKIKRK